MKTLYHLASGVWTSTSTSHTVSRDRRYTLEMKIAGCLVCYWFHRLEDGGVTSASQTRIGLARMLPRHLFSSATIVPSSLSFKSLNILHRRSSHCQCIHGLFVDNQVCHALSRFPANLNLDIGLFLGCPFWRNVLEEVLMRPFLLIDMDSHFCTVGFVASILGIISTSLPMP